MEDCPENPTELFRGWLDHALKESQDANAMVVSTVSSSGRPSSRVVLVRGVTERGVEFFTNYESRKGQQMESNKGVAVNFFWPWLERQVRIEGLVEKLSAEESDAYFASRPRSSQIGAWASDQSKALDSRETLKLKEQGLTKQFEDKAVPRPEHWGGYLIVADYFEFWQGRPSRLHDRVSYTIDDDGSWQRSRLNP